MSAVPQDLADLIAKYRRHASAQEMNDEDLETGSEASIEVVTCEIGQLANAKELAFRMMVIELMNCRSSKSAVMPRSKVAELLTEIALDMAAGDSLVSA